MKGEFYTVYAIRQKHSDYFVAFGKSTGAAWAAAENSLGNRAKKLQKMGYILVEGSWREWRE